MAIDPHTPHAPDLTRGCLRNLGSEHGTARSTFARKSWEYAFILLALFLCLLLTPFFSLPSSSTFPLAAVAVTDLLSSMKGTREVKWERVDFPHFTSHAHRDVKGPLLLYLAKRRNLMVPPCK
jgi:hypothetical protein